MSVRGARLPLLLVAALVADAPAQAEIYRCTDRDGSARFVDRPDACPGARPHQPAGSLVRASRSAAPEGREPRPLDAAQLGEILPAAHEVPGWEVVEEAVLDPADDPDLRRWGVRVQRTRHYTRNGAAGVQVCSIEIWGFETEQQAALGHASIDYRGWRFAREGPLLLMTRGLTRPRGGPRRWEVFPDCATLAGRARERAARHLGREGGR